MVCSSSASLSLDLDKKDIRRIGRILKGGNKPESGVGANELPAAHHQRNTHQIARSPGEQPPDHQRNNHQITRSPPQHPVHQINSTKPAVWSRRIDPCILFQHPGMIRLMDFFPSDLTMFPPFSLGSSKQLECNRGRQSFVGELGPSVVVSQLLLS